MKDEKTPKETRQPPTEAADRQALEGGRGMDNKLVAAAHEQADKDMEADAELTATSPNDDLDEGETARLGENTDLI
ncbi:hypothetical protein [Pseudocnuella soli]|uniref:hypothetical protein n=1 Tax=Pseudocnuella soli TaxID=2502779 RepID=UPI0010511965|nr:hypothetical protein [Pseudocnuella soli]